MLVDFSYLGLMGVYLGKYDLGHGPVPKKKCPKALRRMNKLDYMSPHR